MPDQFTPRPEHKFSFGLWTVGNRGRDPFGDVVRPTLAPTDAVALLAEVGAWGVNLHDNDLVPIDASRIGSRSHRQGLPSPPVQRHGIVVPMATVNLFYDPVFRDGAFTSNDARVRAYAVQKTLRAMDLGAELGAKTFVLWGGREGTETDACRRPDEAVKRLREAVNYLCEYSIDRKYGFRFALEAKPNEPRGDIYMATTGELSRIHRDARASGDGRGQPGGRARADGRAQLRARRRAGVGGRQAVSHRSERSGARPVRSGLPFRIGEPEGGVLSRQVSRRRHIRRPSSFRRARVSNGGLRRCARLRARLHAHLSDSQGAGAAMERGCGNSGTAGVSEVRQQIAGRCQRC